MTLRIAAALCLLLAAAGCGQKGPLYLPGDPDEGRIVLPEALGGPGEDDADDAGDDGDEEPGEAEPDRQADER